MGTSKITKEYRCDEDCEQLGCPTHTATLEFYSVSSKYKFDDGQGNVMWFDIELAQVLIEMFRHYGEIRSDTARV